MNPSFYAHVPADRRLALLSGQPLPQRGRGAVLFADIRGFTPLTELLAREFGPGRGADELAAVLETTFNALIGPVDSFMGSVISMAGDAMVCWFDDRPPGAPTDLPRGARRATACALQITGAVETLKEIRTPSGAGTRIGVKVTVAAGDVRRFLVGDPEVQLFEVLAGVPVQRSADIDHALHESEVAVGAEITGHFGDDLLLGDWRTGVSGEQYRIAAGLRQPVQASPWDGPTELPEETARPFILRPVYERIRSGQKDFLAELRTITALFMNFTGIDYDLDEQAGDRLDHVVRWIQDVLGSYEGSLLQITIGDKGSYIQAAFGAPTAHEDDSRRAVLAALALQDPPARLDFLDNLRIGISQGLVYAGEYGGVGRRVFGALGSEVNIAARLMSQAGTGTILVSQQVAAALRTEFELDDLGSRPLKGVSKPIQVFELKGQLGSFAQFESERSDLVGREAELAQLQEAYERVAAGGRATLVVEGEAGIGKSMLLDRWAGGLRARGVPVLEGNGSAYERASAYFAWRPVMRGLFGLDGQEPQAEAQEQVIARMRAEGAAHLAPLLNWVLLLNFPETEATSPMDSEGRADSTRRLLVRLLAGAFAASPGVIILDDCQYLDSASWALVAAVQLELPLALLVLASRPPEELTGMSENYPRILAQPETILVRIGRLGPKETEALIRARLQLEQLPEPLLDMILRTAEGHPFFSEELAYALRDAGVIRIEQGSARLQGGPAALDNLHFPSTVQGVITSRIDRLDGPLQLTLKTASVIGRTFPFRTLCDIHPGEITTDSQIGAQLNELDRLELVHPEALAPILRHLFKHSITHGVVYQMMTQAQRRSLHRRAAEWHEARFAEKLVPYFPLLAFHWSRAEDPAKAIQYCELAGEEAFRQFAHEEAVSFFIQALELDAQAGHPNPKERRAHWELRAGESFVYWTRYKEAREHLEAGLQLLGEAIPAPGGPAIRALLAAFSRHTLHRLFPRRFLQSREAESPRQQAAARACIRLIEVYFHSGDLLRASLLTFKALNLAEQASPSAELVEAYAGSAPFYAFIRLNRISEAQFSRAHEVHAQVNNLRAYAYLLLVQSGILIAAGRWEEARSSTQKLIATGEQLGSARRVNDGLQHRMILEYSLAQFEASIRSAEELLQSARRIRDARFQGYAHFGIAFCTLRLGDLERCRQSLEDLEALYEGPGAITDAQLAFMLHGLRALLAARSGNWEAALESGALAEAQMEGAFQASWFTLPGYLAAGEAYLACCEHHPADEAILARVAKVVAGLGRFSRTFAIGKAAHELFSGRLAFLSGSPQQARRIWERAVRLCDETLMPYEFALLNYELGSRELGLDPEVRSAHVIQAHQAFRALGLPHESAQAEAETETKVHANA